jgi:hypothetical protein
LVLEGGQDLTWPDNERLNLNGLFVRARFWVSNGGDDTLTDAVLKWL